MPRSLVSVLPLAIPVLLSASSPAAAPDVRPNDNRAPAGALRGGVLTVRLRAAAGDWRPEGPGGPAQPVHAFGVEGGPLQTPGPLLRVPAGTRLRVSLRNEIAGAPLVVYGLSAAGEPDTLQVAPGEVRSVDFPAPAPGTYFYWGTTRGAPTLNARWGPDGQLAGAFIVDPPGARTDDRVFLLSVSSGPGAQPPDREIMAAVMNGRSWPHTERLAARVGDTLRMRLVNVSDRPHPMHLHGFYFRVDARGAIDSDTTFTPEQRRLAVTELVAPGQTARVAWVPERPGNWLFHCHMLAHVSPHLRRGAARHDAGARPHGGNHALEVMSGLAVGVRVSPVRGGRAPVAPTGPARRLRLLVQSRAGYHGAAPGFGYVLQEDGREPAGDSVAIPGTPMVLTRGQPVEITVVNRLAEPTSVHWHGIELDSWFDGVSGWSGSGTRTAPQVAPGDSFLVRFTPPRAGTFIYHTHFEEERQLAAGLYGALLVLEPGERYDPEAERTVMLSGYPGERLGMQVNGRRDTELELRAGRTYRVRVINIHANAAPRLSLLADGVPVTWRLVSKDGAAVPPAQATVRPAVVRIGVGETYDFALDAGAPRELRLVGRDATGGELVAARVRVVP